MVTDPKQGERKSLPCKAFSDSRSWRRGKRKQRRKGAALAADKGKSKQRWLFKLKLKTKQDAKRNGTKQRFWNQWKGAFQKILSIFALIWYIFPVFLTPTCPPDFIYSFLFHNRETCTSLHRQFHWHCNNQNTFCLNCSSDVCGKNYT